jgi:hypothetical protein
VLRDLGRVGAAINEIRQGGGGDLVADRTGVRPRTAENLVAELEKIAEREGAGSDAGRYLRQLGRLVQRRDRLLEESRALGAGGPTKFSPPSEKAGASPKPTSAAESGVTAAEREGSAVTKVIKAGARTGARLAVGLGRLAMALLLPGPDTAIIMMKDFAGSYKEAWEAIEQRYARDGIAFGIAAGMMGLEWSWVTANLVRRFPAAGLEERILGAVGKAEKSFNEGLRRGHTYGAGHPQRMKNEYLGQAFAILADAGYNTDEEGLFNLDTVSRVAGLLMPVADDFLRQAAERKEAREQKAAAENAREARAGNRV